MSNKWVHKGIKGTSQLDIAFNEINYQNGKCCKL